LHRSVGAVRRQGNHGECNKRVEDGREAEEEERQAKPQGLVVEAKPDDASATGASDDHRLRTTTTHIGPLLALTVGLPTLLARLGAPLRVARDDAWSYSRTAQLFHQTGHYQLIRYGRMMLVGHIIWGQPFLWVFHNREVAGNVAGIAKAYDRQLFAGVDASSEQPPSGNSLAGHRTFSTAPSTPTPSRSGASPFSARPPASPAVPAAARRSTVAKSEAISAEKAGILAFSLNWVFQR